VFSLFLVAALASAAADSTDASEARLLNWSELVTANDYPAVALMKEQEGTVTVRLDVDRTGVVTTCKVVISAGSAALDDQTCALFRARARYIPAHDRRGRPVASTVDQRMAWRLAGQAAAPFPRQAWMVRTNLSLDAAGKIVDCKLEATGLATIPKWCSEVFPNAAETAARVAPADIVGVTITETHFYLSAPADVVAPPDVRGATRIAQQVSRVTIDAGGRISDCEAVSYSGAAAPERDACAFLAPTRFDAAAAAKPLTATVVMTVYFRKLSST
jgi:TonB family protein